MLPYVAKNTTDGVSNRTMKSNNLLCTNSNKHIYKSKESQATLLSDKETSSNIDQFIQDFNFHGKSSLSMSKLLRREENRRTFRQQRPHATQRKLTTILSHNINGSGAGLEEMRHRMLEFRSRQIGGHQPDFILLQETHVGSLEKAHKLEQLWKIGWGIKSSKVSSWWSMHSDASAGVAILVNPLTVKGQIRVHPSFPKTERTLAIEMEEFVLINIYAPSKHVERELFFAKLSQNIQGLQKPAIVAGDWNMVVNPIIDRNHTPKRSHKTESRNFDTLVSNNRLIDTVSLVSSSLNLNVEEYDELVYGRTMHTFFRGESSSRLDRCYVSDALVSHFVSHQVVSSAVFSDHRMIAIKLAFDSSAVQGMMERKVFPSAIGNQKLVDLAVKKVIDFLLVQFESDGDILHMWDLGKLLLSYVLHRTAQLHKHQQRIRMRRAVKRFLGGIDNPTKNEFSVQDKNRLAEFKLQKLQRRNDLKKFKAMSNTYNNSAFFQRHSGRDSHYIDKIEGEAPTGPTQPAVNMAAGWKSLFQTKFSSLRKAKKLLEIDHDGVFEGLKGKISTIHQDLLIRPFTLEEVLAAIKKMKSGKTPGPDLVGNEFYSDYKEVLAPILVRLFNHMQQHSVLFESAKIARIFPIPKVKGATNPLHFRPISCLNGDYKLYTRILAERLKLVLMDLLGEHQHGGLPRRKLDHALYKVLSLMETKFEDSNSHSSKPALVMLDIQKAYDTLERPFILTVLSKFGFPTVFIDQIRAIHSGTKAYFVVNNFRSETLDTTRGIRQGCPIAPLIFILALEVLLLKVEVHTKISGLEAGIGLRKHRINSVAFIDDTLIPLGDIHMLSQLNIVLSQFAKLSGLQVNPSKTKVLPLFNNTETRSVDGFQLMKNSDKARYLGVYLTHQEARQVNWSLFKTKLQLKLVLFSKKTTNFVSRLRLLQSTVVPAFTFLVQYILPTCSLVKELQKMINAFFWMGFAPKDGLRVRNKINPHILTLPTKQGGLGLPNLEYEVFNLSIRIGAQWALSSFGDPYSNNSHQKNTLHSNNEDQVSRPNTTVINNLVIDNLVCQQNGYKHPIVPFWCDKRMSNGRNESVEKFWQLVVWNMSRVVYGDQLFSECVKIVNTLVQEAKNIVIHVTASDDSLTWSIAYFDRVKWCDLQKKLEIQIQQFRHLFWYIPISFNPFLFMNVGRIFSKKLYGNLTLSDIFSVQKWNRYNGTIKVHKSIPKQRLLVKMCVLLDIFGPSRFPIPTVISGLGELKFEVNLQSSGALLVHQDHNIFAQYLDFDKSLCFQNRYNKQLSAFVPSTFPYIKFVFRHVDKNQLMQQKEGKRVKWIVRLLLKDAKIKFFEYGVTILEKRVSDWKTKEKIIPLILKQINFFNIKWRINHAIGVENFFLKLRYNLHNLWYDGCQQRTRCIYAQCQQQKTNTMVHILFECTTVVYLWCWFISIWIGGVGILHKPWIEAIILGKPLVLPITFLLEQKELWSLSNFPMLIKLSVNIWAICTQTILVVLWRERNQCIALLESEKRKFGKHKKSFHKIISAFIAKI